jgi:hypothetical protein
MRNGFVSIHRKLQNDPIWLSEKFTRAQAWVDLILLANHSDGYIRKSGHRIPVKRGQCGWSKLRLADRWGWSRGKVDRFLKELEIDGWIEQQTGQQTTIININEYNTYQETTNKKRTPKKTTDEHQTDIKQDTNNNNNNNNNDYNNKGDVVFDVPSFVDGDVWLRWVKFRKEKKKTLTPTTIEAQIKKLTKWHEAGHDVNAIIEQSIAQGWVGLFEIKKGNQNDRLTKSQRADRELQELLDRERY